MMRNTLPPLASNDLLGIADVTRTRYDNSIHPNPEQSWQRIGFGPRTPRCSQPTPLHVSHIGASDGRSGSNCARVGMYSVPSTKHAICACRLRSATGGSSLD